MLSTLLLASLLSATSFSSVSHFKPVLTPDLVCVDDTNHGTLRKHVQSVTGSLESTTSTLSFTDHSCFESYFVSDPGEHELNVLNFTITIEGWYTFLLGADFGAQFSMYQGEFFQPDPCANFLGAATGNTTFPMPESLLVSNDAMSFYLSSAVTYSIVVSNLNAGEFGNWELLAFSELGGLINGLMPPETQELRFELLCADVDVMLFENDHSWIVNADGSLDTVATRDEYFGGDQAALDDFLKKLHFAGMPTATSDCGPMVITQSDEFSMSGDCGNKMITRNFAVRPTEASGCPLIIDECEQVITLRRAILDDVGLAPYAFTIPCDTPFPTDGPTGGPDENPIPGFSGRPYLNTLSGTYPLDETILSCTVAASYSDEPHIDICEGRYRFRREWNLIDWCNPSDSRTYNEIISIGDDIGPVFIGPNDPILTPLLDFPCLSLFQVPLPEVAPGNGCSELRYTVFEISYPGGLPVATGGLGEGSVAFLELGEYDLTRCVEDECGNESCLITRVVVIDEVQPISICQDSITVVLGPGDIANNVEGITRVYPEDIDDGSIDNCGPVELLIRRNYWEQWTCDSNPDNWSPWGEFFDVFCCDRGTTISAQLLVVEENNMLDTCLTFITVEDLFAPFCYTPENESFSCENPPEDYPDDIEEAYSTNFSATSQLMNSLFGGASGTDNCAVDTIVERTPLIQVNDCGIGTITRYFEAWQALPDVNLSDGLQEDEVSRSINNCSQLITIRHTADFEIAFPADAEIDCSSSIPTGVEITTNGCDVIAVNTSIAESYPPTGEECFQLAVVYDVINWCQWDGLYEGYEIPRLTEEDGTLLATGYSVEEAERPILRMSSETGPDDENCDGELSPSENGTDDANDLRYFLTIDRSHPDTDGDSSLPDEQFDNVADTTPDCLPADANGARNYGRYRYTQILQMVNATDLVINTLDFGGPTDLCPDLQAGQFGDAEGGCETEVQISFVPLSACDLLTDIGSEISYTSLLSASLDAFAVDANGDGEIDAGEFVADEDVMDLIQDNGDGTFTFSGTFPISTVTHDNIVHALFISFADNCGNQNGAYVEFEVVDCAAPTPTCFNEFMVDLEPQLDGSCATTLQATELIAAPLYDCTGQVMIGLPDLLEVTTYAIYFAADVEGNPDFSPSPSDSIIVVSEDESVFVYVFAFDEEGNYDFCETLLIPNPDPACFGTIAGIITTRDDETVADAEVNISNEYLPLTQVDGTYLQGGLDRQQAYGISPFLNTDHSNGVKTIDLIILAKHLNGIELMGNPYQLIAADVDNSGDITAADFELLRQLILGNIDAFPNNTSWRFVVADYVFPVPTNPWLQSWPETITLADLLEDVLDANFVGVKIGDLDGSAESNARETAYKRALAGKLNLEAADIALKAGEIYTIPIHADLNDMLALQGTMQFNGLELIDIEYDLIDENNFGLRFLDQGYLTFSWGCKDALQCVSTTDNALFSLVIRAQQNILLSKALGINSRYTPAEAYAVPTTQRPTQVFELGIHFRREQTSVEVTKVDDVFLYQNVPNPFSEECTIRFYLPEATPALLTITDLSGKTVALIDGSYSSGHHTVFITDEMLNGASGVYYYSLQVGDELLTRKMVILAK